MVAESPAYVSQSIDTAALAADPTAQPAASDAGRQSAAGGYSAIDTPTSGTRRAPATRLLSEDQTLTQRKRARLLANSRETVRNISVAQWAINKHLDYVSRFRFRALTSDEGFNREFEAMVAELGRRRSFDLAQRHSLSRSVRLTEAHAVLEGDGAWLKYAATSVRGRVQLVEGDLIRHEGFKLPREQRDQWVNGIRVNPQTKADIAYAIADRTRTGYKPGRIVAARNILRRSYYSRFDQVRGIGPFACALNTLRDTDESFDFARAKIKLAQMLGLKFTRQADGPLGEYLANTLRSEGENDPADDEGPRYDVDLSGGMFAVDIDRGDNVELLESRTPATETTDFLRLMIHVAIRSLDLPYSFWDESFTNFYGQRGSFLAYIQACQPKREDNQELLDDWTRWRGGMAIADGEIRLPRGMAYDDLAWTWVPVGQPWWDPNKEIAAQLSAISAGLTSPQRVCHETGTDFENNVDQISQALKYAEERNVTLSFDVAAAHRVALEEQAAAEAAAAERSAGHSPETEDDIDEQSVAA